MQEYRPKGLLYILTINQLLDHFDAVALSTKNIVKSKGSATFVLK